MTPLPDKSSESFLKARVGVAYGLTAYFIWGFFPLFFKQLTHVPPLQVLAHRIVWSMATLVLFVAVDKGWGRVRSAMANPKAISILAATTILIAANWFVFILAVDHGMVLQSSFGYFINPLVSVLLGFLFLGEKLRRLQAISLVAACIGVLILTLQHGQLPWIALVLAGTFGLYGLLRKIVPVDALAGLFMETLLLFPVAAGYLICVEKNGTGAFLNVSTHTTLFLCAAGVITSVPLLMFAASARRLRLTTIGFMQYITPTMHFLLAVAVFAEPFSPPHLISFLFIWAGLALYSWDAARSMIGGKRAY